MQFIPISDPNPNYIAKHQIVWTVHFQTSKPSPFPFPFYFSFFVS